MPTLLVPLDFSDATGPVLDQTSMLAKALQAGVVLFHVVEPVATYIPVGASMDVLAASPASEPQDTSAAQSRLETIASDLRHRVPRVDCETVVGLAAEEILERAAVEKDCILVVGSHGHGALYHLFSGSVVNGILRKARCPVHVVPVRSGT